MKSKFVVVMVLAVLSTSAFAGTLPIINAGFEDKILSDGQWEYGVPGWELLNPISGDYGTWNPDNTGNIFYGYGGLAPEGQNVAYTSEVETTTDVFVEGGMRQVLAATLAANTEYVLTVSVGNSYYYEWGGGYKVQLLAGGILLNEDDNSIAIATDTFEVSTVIWDSTGVAAGYIGLPLEIRLIAKAGNGEVDFDNVQLVPEPATMALFGLGGLLLARRKKA